MTRVLNILISLRIFEIFSSRSRRDARNELTSSISDLMRSSYKRVYKIYSVQHI